MLDKQPDRRPRRRKSRKTNDPTHQGSASEGISDLRFRTTIQGREVQLTAEEAVQQKTFEAALAGNHRAVKEVLNWMSLRYQKTMPVGKLMRHFIQREPAGVNDALLILGIASEDDRPVGVRGANPLLESWAVAKALSRCGSSKKVELQLVRRIMKDKDVAIRGLDTIDWERLLGDE